MCACYLRSGQPSIFVLSVVHVPVKGVELAVTEVAHVHQVILPASVVVALTVSLPRKIQPLWMTKLIPCKSGRLED